MVHISQRTSGLPFSFAHFISPESAEAAIDAYRRAFRPSALGSEPYVSLGVFVICADSDEQAMALARCRDVWRTRVERGEFTPFPTVEEACRAPVFRRRNKTRIDARRGHLIAGTQGRCDRAQLEGLAETTGADELAVVCITPEFEGAPALL